MTVSFLTINNSHGLSMKNNSFLERRWQQGCFLSSNQNDQQVAKHTRHDLNGHIPGLFPKTAADIKKTLAACESLLSSRVQAPPTDSSDFPELPAIELFAYRRQGCLD